MFRKVPSVPPKNIMYNFYFFFNVQKSSFSTPPKKWCDWLLKVDDTFDTLLLQYLLDEVSEVVYE